MSGEHNEKEQASLPSRLAGLSGSESSNDPSTKLPATVNAKLVSLPRAQQLLSTLTQRVVSRLTAVSSTVDCRRIPDRQTSECWVIPVKDSN
jgi:hypothetical protein